MTRRNPWRDASGRLLVSKSGASRSAARRAQTNARTTRLIHAARIQFGIRDSPGLHREKGQLIEAGRPSQQLVFTAKTTLRRPRSHAPGAGRRNLCLSRLKDNRMNLQFLIPASTFTLRCQARVRVESVNSISAYTQSTSCNFLSDAPISLMRLGY